MKKHIYILILFSVISYSCKDEWDNLKQDFNNLAKNDFKPTIFNGIDTLKCENMQIRNLITGKNEAIKEVSCLIKVSTNIDEITLKNPFEINNLIAGQYDLTFNYKQNFGKETISYQKLMSTTISNGKSANLGEIVLEANKTKDDKALLKIMVNDNNGFAVPKVKTCLYLNRDYRDKLVVCQGGIDSTETDGNGRAVFAGLTLGTKIYVKVIKNFSINSVDNNGKSTTRSVYAEKKDEIVINGFKKEIPFNEINIRLDPL